MDTLEVMNWLHPKAAASFETLNAMLEAGFKAGRTAHRFVPFEGYRSPAKQLTAFVNRRSKARPFESAHQYGLAIDYVPHGQKGFYWPDNGPDWTFLRTVAHECGLRNTIEWDRPHVWHPIWDQIQPYT